jgi:myo-inositol 2-dehydrogenase / D-chiro-inositol 1-dehydrogenase
MRIGLAGAGRIGARHAETLSELPEVESVVIADADPARATELADKHGVQAVDGVDALFATGFDGLVVAAATDAHAELVMRAAATGRPVFCEKPVAPDVLGTLQVIEAVAEAGVVAQIGFQRRFDTGHAQIRSAVRAGSLGWLHTLRSCTFDPAPPPAAYVPGSGGLFRDCVVHDIDAIRFITGREIVQAVAVGANRGADFFAASGDVDTAAALLTLDDDTIALVSATRYNGAGYDVRLEAFGSRDSLVTGLDERTPLTPADASLTTAGSLTTPTRAYGGFLERFAPAYRAELGAFIALVAGRGENRCPPEDALEALYVAEACERSRTDGRIVMIDEVRK